MADLDIEPRKPFVVRERRLILLSTLLILLIISLSVLGNSTGPTTSQQAVEELSEQEVPLSLMICISAFLVCILASFSWLLHTRSQNRSALPNIPPVPAAWRFEDVILVFVVTIALSQTALMLLDGSFKSMIVVDSVVKIISVLVIFALIDRRGQEPFQVLGLDLRSGLRDSHRAFACFFVFLPFLFAISHFWQQLLIQLQGELYDPLQDVVKELAKAETAQMMMLILIAAIVIAPIAEEMFFRGFLYGFLRKHVRPSIAIAFVGALFGLSHSDIAAQIPTALLGVFFCYIYERTGRLAVPILLHAFYNSAQIFIIMSYRIG